MKNKTLSFILDYKKPKRHNNARQYISFDWIRKSYSRNNIGEHYGITINFFSCVNGIIVILENILICK